MHRLVLLLLVVEFVLTINLCLTGYSDVDGWAFMPLMLMLLGGILIYIIYMKKGQQFSTIGELLVLEYFALISIVKSDCGPESYILAVLPIACIIVFCMKGMAAEMGRDH